MKEAGDLTAEEIGTRIKLLRLKANLSQEDLAARVNTSQNIISRMERGLGTLTIVCDILNFFSVEFKLDNFFQKTYTLDNIHIAGDITPLESVAIERLIMLKEELQEDRQKMVNELTHTISLLKGESL